MSCVRTDEYVRLDEVTKIIEEQIRKRYCLEMGATDRTVLNVLQVVKARIWKLDIVEAEPVRHDGHVVWKNRFMGGFVPDITITDKFGEKHTGTLDTTHYEPVPYCSECGKELGVSSLAYCPNCGAKMDGG